MNRRGFLQLFGSGVVGALALTKIPHASVPTFARSLVTHGCTKRLQDAYDAFELANGREPTHFVVGLDLRDGYIGELVQNQRCMVSMTLDGGYKATMFREVPVVWNHKAQPWSIVAEGELSWRSRS